jgi:hypothetical protein
MAPNYQPITTPHGLARAEAFATAAAAGEPDPRRVPQSRELGQPPPQALQVVTRAAAMDWEADVAQEDNPPHGPTAPPLASPTAPM